jgi:hypothetical protein
MYFTLTATWENGLGFLHTIRDLDTPKYEAILQLAQQPQAWDNAFGDALPLHRDGSQFTLGRVDWYVPPVVLPLSPLQWSAYHFDADDTGIYRVWVEYGAPAGIAMAIYAGGELLATVTEGTGGAPAVSAAYTFVATPGLRAVRIENHGDLGFDLIGVHVELVQATSVEDAPGQGGVFGDVVAIRNHPNPFGAETEIRFELRRDTRIALDVFDARGRLVSTLIDEFKPAGRHAVPLAGVELPAGVYFYRARTPSGDTGARKMLHIK